MFHKFLSRLFCAPAYSRSKRGTGWRAPAPRRPLFESLEDRRLLAVTAADDNFPSSETASIYGTASGIQYSIPAERGLLANDAGASSIVEMTTPNVVGTLNSFHEFLAADGVLEVNLGDGSLEIRGPADFAGSVTFSYTISDGVDQDTANVTVAFETGDIPLKLHEPIYCMGCSCDCSASMITDNAADGSLVIEVLDDFRYIGQSSGKPLLSYDHLIAANFDGSESYYWVDDEFVGSVRFSPGSDPDELYRTTILPKLDDKASGVLEIVIATKYWEASGDTPLHTTRHRGFKMFNRLDDTGWRNHPLGERWSLQSMNRLEEVRGDTDGDDNDLFLVMGNGNTYLFLADGQGGFRQAEGDQSEFSIVKADDGYQLTDKDYNVWNFSSGLLRSHTDRNGNTTRYRYEDDRLAAVTTPTGRTTGYTYEDGRLIRITDDAGRVTDIEYAGGKLTGILQPDPGDGRRPEYSFAYDEAKRLVAFTDPLGNVNTFSYDEADMLTTRTLPSGASTSLSAIRGQGFAAGDYGDNATGYLSGVDATPFSVSAVLGERIDELGNRWTFQTDGFGNLVWQTDPLGNSRTWSRDGDGRPMLVTEPDPDGDGPLVAPVHSFAYVGHDNNGRGQRTGQTLWSTTTEHWYYQDAIKGQPTRYVSPYGTVTYFDLDANGNVTRSRTVLDQDGIEQTELVHHYAYAMDNGPLNGQLTQITDPLGRVTTIEYDSQGRPFTKIYHNGDSIQWNYDDHGRLRSYRDELGNETTYSYDRLDRLISIMLADPDGPGPMEPPVTSFSYDLAGQLTRKTDPLGRVTSFRYDSMGNVIEISEPGFNAHDIALTRFEYDVAGRLVTVIDALGRETGYEYNELHQLTRVTQPDPDGPGPMSSPELAYVYDALDRLVQETDPLGNSTDYLHDKFGFDVTVMLPSLADGTRPAWRTIYDVAGEVVSVVDPLGRITNHERDSLGQVTATTHGSETESATTWFDYDLAGNVIARTDELGSRVGYLFDARDRVTRVVYADPDGDGPLRAPEESFVYDAAGRVLASTDPLGATTSYEYDALGRMTRALMPDPGSGSPVYRYQYDAASNLLGVIDPLGGETNYAYGGQNNPIHKIDPDPDGAGPQARPKISFSFNAVGSPTRLTDSLGRTTAFTYDNLDRPIQRQDPGLNGGAHWFYEYDEAGNLIAQTDPLGGVTEFEYDAHYRTIQIVQPDPHLPSGSNRPAWKFEYDPAGQLVAEHDPLDRTTGFKYDGLGRVVEKTRPDPDGPGPEEAPTYAYVYDALGNLLREVDPLMNAIEYSYDDLHRLVRMQRADPDGPGPLEAPQVEYGYDLAGQRIYEKDPTGQTTTFAYDLLGRVTRTRLPDPDDNGPQTAPETSYTYDDVGNILTESNALGQTTAFAYDGLHRMIAITDPNGATTHLSLDPAGNLIGLIDPLGNTTAWEYDAADRMVRETNAFNESRRFEYDLAGNLTAKTDRNGRITQYDYDRLHRLVEEQWLAANGQTIHVIAFDYDLVGNLIGAADPNASYAYSFDALDRNTATTSSIAGLQFHVEFQSRFDSAGNRTRLSAKIGDRDDFINRYHYDSLYRTTEIVQSGSENGNAVAAKKIALHYDSADRLLSVSRFEGGSNEAAGMLPESGAFVATTEFQYDRTGRLTDMSHASWDATLAGYHWNYDAANRVTQFDSLLDGLTEYHYDDGGQITAAISEFEDSVTFEYDDNGNRISGGAIIGRNNRLRSDSHFEYAYDAEGNRTRKTEIATGEFVSYRWDHRNRLTGVTRHDSNGELQHSVSYAYDAFDRRIEKVIAPGVGPAAPEDVSRFVYNKDHMAFQFRGDGRLANRYLHGPEVDQILSDEHVVDYESPGNVLWPFTDNLGSVRDVADYDDSENRAIVVNHIVYSTFGSVVSEWDASVDHLFGYTGRDRDEDAGLQYHRARYYDVSLGRWISEDPSGFAAGDANLVRYVGNSATNATDPTGLEGTAVFARKPTWKNGGQWWLRNAVLTYHGHYGELSGGRIRGSAPAWRKALFDNPFATHLAAGTITLWEIRGAFHLKDKIVCGNRTIDVDIELKFRRKIKVKVMNRLSMIGMMFYTTRFLGAKIPRTLTVPSALQFLDGTVRGISDAAVIGYDVWSDIKRLSKVTTELDQIYTVIEDDNVKLEISPALVCALGIKRLKIRVSGLQFSPWRLGFGMRDEGSSKFKPENGPWSDGVWNDFREFPIPDTPISFPGP